LRLEADIFSKEMVDAALKAVDCPHKLTVRRDFYEVLLRPQKGHSLTEAALSFNDALISSVRLRL
jgi:hypothetical protein